MITSLHLIPLTLFTICISAIVTLYLSYRIRTPECFGKVLRFTIFYILLNSMYSFLMEISGGQNLWKDRITPFMILYGPLLYFGIIALRDRKLPVKMVLLHCLPFFYFSIFFLLTLIDVVRPTTSLYEMLNKQLYIIGPVSFVGYTLISFLAGRNLFAKQFRDKLLIFVFGRVALLFVAMLFIMIGFSKTMSNNPSAVYLLRMMIYSCMLLFIIIVINFTINKILDRFPGVGDSADDTDTIKAPSAKYERSTLSESQLAAYERKLDYAMRSEKLYLDTTLSLTTLAQHLKSPNHHLTQVLSVQVNQTFYQYINGFRIACACELLDTLKNDINLEDLADRSGFNSKVSFNRQFKNIKGCTPSEYRNKLI